MSVIMPCYNAGEFLESSIRSVLDQDYPGPIELIVADDGSTDDSVAIASGIEGVRVLTQANRGPAAARNLAIEHATGRYIAFLDADDLWLPGSLRQRVDCLERDPTVSVVFGNFTRWTPSANAGEPDAEIPDPLPSAVLESIESGWLYPEILLDPIVHIITAVVRREVFDTVGKFDPSLRLGEDYEFWIRASQRFRFRRVDVMAARYRMHSSSTTRIPKALNYEWSVVRRAMEEYGLTGARGVALDQRLLFDRLHQLCFKHGYLHFWHGDPAVAAASFSQSLRFRPRRLRAWGYAALATIKSIAWRAVKPSVRAKPS